MDFSDVLGELLCYSTDMLDMFHLFLCSHLKISYPVTALGWRVLGHELCKVDP